DRADHHQATAVLAVEEAVVVERLGLVSAQDQLAELAFLARQSLLALAGVEASADIEIGLALVAAEVEHFEGAEILVCRLQLALHADQALASGVDAELAEVRPISMSA